MRALRMLSRPRDWLAVGACLALAALFVMLENAREVLKYDHLIEQAAAEAGGVDPLLVRALIWRESNFDPRAVGLAGERGLMQVMPKTGKEWAAAKHFADFSPDHLFDPEVNIRAGTWYLVRALRNWSDRDNPVPFALAQYNAGRTNALRWVDPAAPKSQEAFLQRMDFPSTRRYVAAILRQYHYYQSTAQRMNCLRMMLRAARLLP